MRIPFLPRTDKAALEAQLTEQAARLARLERQFTELLAISEVNARTLRMVAETQQFMMQKDMSCRDNDPLAGKMAGSA